MLTFNLKKEWFDKIKSGEKTIEYREVKPYWKSRIDRVTQPWSDHPHCIFRLGYTKTILNAEITSIEIVNGKDTDLHIDKDVYAIHFRLIKEVEE